MTRFLVVARADGRGGIKPFNVKGWGPKTRVRIGKKAYKVTSDGRVNIPKSVMDIGRTVKGRKVIEVKFSTKVSPKGRVRQVAMLAMKPRLLSANPRTGKKARKLSPAMVAVPPHKLEPKDFTEYNWSPE